MNVEELKKYLRETFAGIRMDEAGGDIFVTYDPDGDLPTDRWLPFATIVTGDNYDTVSDLNHPGAYRLNIGLTTSTYTALFGAAPTTRDDQGILTTDHDYAARSQLMPHPHYANQHWVSVVNPAGPTVATVHQLLTEAHNFATRKHKNQKPHQPHP